MSTAVPARLYTVDSEQIEANSNETGDPARAHIPLLRRADRRGATAGRSRHARRRGHPQARHLRGDVLRVEKTLRIAWEAGDPRTAPAARGERAAQAPRCGSDA